MLLKQNNSETILSTTSYTSNKYTLFSQKKNNKKKCNKKQNQFLTLKIKNSTPRKTEFLLIYLFRIGNVSYRKTVSTFNRQRMQRAASLGLEDSLRVRWNSPENSSQREIGRPRSFYFEFRQCVFTARPDAINSHRESRSQLVLRLNMHDLRRI